MYCCLRHQSLYGSGFNFSLTLYKSFSRTHLHHGYRQIKAVSAQTNLEMKVQGRPLQRHPSSRQVIGRISKFTDNASHMQLRRTQHKPTHAELHYMCVYFLVLISNSSQLSILCSTLHSLFLVARLSICIRRIKTQPTHKMCQEDKYI